MCASENGVAESRLGMYKPPWINNLTPEIDSKGASVYDGAWGGVFRNPGHQPGVYLIAADNKVYYTRQNNNPIQLSLPTGSASPAP